jgi:PAT family beta-lactamase induction signal transducer AmpG
MNAPAAPAVQGWRAALPAGVRPYVEAAPLAAAFLGLSSSVGFAMVAATLTTRLAQYGIRKSAVTAFALTFLAFNFKFLWAPLVDTVRLPVLGRFGQRRSWLWLMGVVVMAAIAWLGSLDPSASVSRVAYAAILLGIVGATYDIVIDAYRIELLEPHQLGVGSGMHQYGWRLGSAGSGALALVIAARYGWGAAYTTCALFAVPAMIVGVVMGEPSRRRPAPPPQGVAQAVVAYFSPLVEFLQRRGALVVLAFVLIHKIGDTLANLTLRLLFEELQFTNDEIAFYDVGVGFVALLAGVFVGGAMYASMGMKRSVFVSLVLMAVSNFSFIGGVTVVAYMSALCNLRFTATQYALLSALASIAGRFLTGTTAGGLIEAMGFVNFYLLTTFLAMPGVVLYGYMVRSGLADVSMGTAGTGGD